MTKWADYLISAVSYTQTNKKKYISKLKVHVDKGESIGPDSIWTRNKVIKYIDDGKSFKTIYKNSGGNCTEGEDVQKIKIGKYYYLRTDANNIEEDNLGELPEF